MDDRGDLLSVSQAARRLGVSRSYAYQLVDAGALEAVRVAVPGRRGVLRIEPEALAVYRERLRRAARQPPPPPAVDPDAVLQEIRRAT